MSFHTDWDVEKYREEHETDEQWLLRKAFIEKWKTNYPEERLVCLARVFTNIEFLGCRYPPEVMREVAALSQEVAKSYRAQKKTKLQRTFVSASDAAVDRARGVKREGGVVASTSQAKSMRISFVKPGEASTLASNSSASTYSASTSSASTSSASTSAVSTSAVSTSAASTSSALASSASAFSASTSAASTSAASTSAASTSAASTSAASTSSASTSAALTPSLPANAANLNDENTVSSTVTTQNEESGSAQQPSSGMFYEEYLNELNDIRCMEMMYFHTRMFQTQYGELVLLIRPWISRISNIRASCDACRVTLSSSYENGKFSLSIDGKLLAEGFGQNKQEAKSASEAMAWNILKSRVISVLVKEQFIAQNDARVSVSDVSSSSQYPDDNFGTPLEGGVARRMMAMMGWRGGGLGADSQGIPEPIRPNLQMVNRAGLGSRPSDVWNLRVLANNLMRRYIQTSSLDVDLVFSSEFTKEERAGLHQVAQRVGLASRSYGINDDRFLVVKKKLNPFMIVKSAVIEGGNTAKYRVFIPFAVYRN